MIQRDGQNLNANIRVNSLWQGLQQHANDVPCSVPMALPWGIMTVELQQVESLSCRVAQISADTRPLGIESVEQFFRRAESLVNRLSCRLFPLELLELDTMTPAFQARSPRGSLVGEPDGATYYELDGTPQQIVLRRFVKRVRGERLPDHFTLTQEMVNAFADAVAQSIVSI